MSLYQKIIVEVYPEILGTRDRTSGMGRKKFHIYHFGEAVSTFNRVRVPYKKYNAYLDVIDLAYKGVPASNPSWVTIFDPRQLVEHAWETCL